jgi:hypothetical protein
MPEVFGHKPSRDAVFRENHARERAFRKSSEPIRSSAYLDEASDHAFVPAGAGLWEVPPNITYTLEAAVTDNDVWEQPDTRCALHYVGGQRIWCQIEYSGSVRRANGPTFGAANYLFHTLGWNIGVGVPTSGDQDPAQSVPIHYDLANDIYGFCFKGHQAIDPDTYIAPMFMEWFFRTETLHFDMNFSIYVTRSEHG